MSNAQDDYVTDLDADLCALVEREMKEMKLHESNAATVNNIDGSGFSGDDELVINQITKYKYSISPAGKMPGTLSLNELVNVAYDATSDYAKKTSAKRETYFAKFTIAYPIGDPYPKSKYCSVRSAIIDLLPRPLKYGEKQNTYALEYAAVYFPCHVIDEFKKLIEEKGYALDAVGINVDMWQSLVSINASYASQEVPRIGMHRTSERDEGDGTVTEVKVLDRSKTIHDMYKCLHGSGGALLKGYAFGEFGVSKQVAIGAPPPPSGSCLKITFKLLGFHVLSNCTSVKAIKSKSARSKFGV